MKIKIGDVLSFKNLANKEKTGMVIKIDLAFNGFDTRYQLSDLFDENVSYTTTQDKVTNN